MSGLPSERSSAESVDAAAAAAALARARNALIARRFPIFAAGWIGIGVVTLEVGDDGCGFAFTSRHGRDALGLVGMEERALALGGHLTLRSAPGEGTTVRLQCPVALRVPASAA